MPRSAVTAMMAPCCKSGGTICAAYQMGANVCKDKSKFQPATVWTGSSTCETSASIITAFHANTKTCAEKATDALTRKQYLATLANCCSDKVSACDDPAPATTAAATTAAATTAAATTTTKACPKVACPGVKGYTGCDSVPAGGKKTCSVSSPGAPGGMTPPLGTKCMSSTFEIACPANNNDAKRAAMLSGKNVLCQACGFGNQAPVDTDPEKDKFTVSLSWGPLAKKVEDEVKFVQGQNYVFDYYHIFMVDDYGARYGDAAAGAVAAPQGVSRKTTCCNPREYRTTISGTWPAGATRFMIVPTDSKTSFTLPMGKMTDKFIDATSGPARTVHKSSSTIKFSEADATELMAAPDRFNIMQKSLHASMADMELDFINVYGMTKVVARRLGDAEGRRLAESSIKVDFKIIIPATSTIKFTAASIDVAKMAAAVTTQAKASGLEIKVVGVPSVAAVQTEVTGGETVTGAASPMAGSALAALVMAIATMLMA